MFSTNISQDCVQDTAVSNGSSEPLFEPVHWYRVGTLDALFAKSDCAGVEIDQQPLGLFKVDDAVYALDDICTHGHARLSEGELDGHEIECPLHAGVFDVRTGGALCAPLARDARCHKVRIEDGVLFVATSQSETQSQ